MGVLRSDGVSLPAQDFWQTTRTFIGNSLPPLDEDRLHILDHDGTGSYTLIYAPVDQTPPTIVQVSPPSQNPAMTPVDGLTVTFSKAIDPTTLTGPDLTLTRNGGPDLDTVGADDHAGQLDHLSDQRARLRSTPATASTPWSSTPGSRGSSWGSSGRARPP